MFYFLKKFFLALIGLGIKRGKLLICAGCPEQIEVETGFTPYKVSLTFCNFSQPPVCVGDVDSFDVQIVPNGFVIIAKIKGQSRELKWTAVGR